MTDTCNTAPSTDTGASDWEAMHATHDALRSKLQGQNKAALFDALATAGITHVVVSFDRYGDSGQIENIEVKADDAIVAMPETDIEIASATWGEALPDRTIVRVAEAVEQLAYDLLNDTHCGWENNDGAYGDFIFDVAERTITLDYNERYTASDYSQHVF
jgi:hypothetical protein